MIPFCYYLGSTTDIDDPVLTQILQQKLSISGNDIMKTLADKWMEKGMQEGIQEGKQEAERKIVMNLLTLKFNNIDESTIKKVETAPSEQLIQWSERILFATTLDEVFK